MTTCIIHSNITELSSKFHVAHFEVFKIHITTVAIRLPSFSFDWQIENALGTNLFFPPALSINREPLQIDVAPISISECHI